MTDEMTAWLRAQLDADERAAREAQTGPWHIGNAVDPTQLCNVHTFPGSRGVADGLRWLDAEHIIRHDPASVLNDVEAKRRMVDLAEYMLGFDSPTGDLGRQPLVATAGREMLRLLALSYAHRPGYQEAWRR